MANQKIGIKKTLLGIWIFTASCLGRTLGRARLFQDTTRGERSEMKPEGWFYWWVMKNIVARFVGFFWVGKVEGLENIPSDGPLLAVPNHASFIDFMVIMHALRDSGHLTFFIKEKYFEMSLWEKFLIEMLQIKADRRSIVSARKVLREGRPLILFAEGTRTRDGEVGGAYPGLEVISSFVDTPVIPVGIKGAYELWPWNKKFPSFLKMRSIQISFGKSLRAKEFEDKKVFSDRVMGEIKKLAK